MAFITITDLALELGVHQLELAETIETATQGWAGSSVFGPTKVRTAPGGRKVEHLSTLTPLAADTVRAAVKEASRA
jgi:hypothetical protein